MMWEYFIAFVYGDNDDHLVSSCVSKSQHMSNSAIITQTMGENELGHACLYSHALTNMDLCPPLSNGLLKCLPTSLLTWCHLLTMTNFQLLVSPLCTFRNVLTWFDRTTPAWDLIGGRTERLLTHERIAGTEVNLKIMMCRLLQWAHTLSTSKFYHGSWHEDTFPSTVFQLGAIQKVRGHVMNLIKGAHEY